MKNWFTALEGSQQKNVIMLSWSVTILSFFIGAVATIFSYVFVAGLVVSILFIKWSKQTNSCGARSSFPQTEAEQETQVETSSPAPDPTETTANDSPLDPEPEIEPAQKKVERHRVAGISFREDAIKDLLGENSAYFYTKKELVEAGYIEERVYKNGPYYGTAVLEPEPDNPHDHKAVKVMTAGVHIGYIKAGSCAHIHKVLREELIEKAEIEIAGGDYRIVLEEYDDYADKSSYSLGRDSIPLHAVLTLTLK